MIIILNMDKQKCFKCNWEWLPRSEKIPIECPNCKNRRWNEVKEKLTIG